MPYSERSKLLAFLLNVIPGLGHYYWSRKGSAFVYTILCFGSAIGGVGLALVLHRRAFAAVGLVFALLIWGISMLHIIIALLRGNPQSQPQALQRPMPPGYSSRQGFEGAEYDTGYTEAPIPMNGNAENERFFTILLSFIPGLGHLHMGLMQRGLSFLISFFGLSAVLMFIAVVTHESGFIVFLGVLPIIWLYCMFDAVQHIHRKQAGEVLEDRTLFDELEHGRIEGRRSKVLATILSAFPGAGHMYLGLQKRGLQLMIIFLGSIYVLDTLRLSLFLFLIPVIWFYSFFDALQQVSRYGREPLNDRPIVGMFANHQRWLGLGLLLLGGYYILMNVLIPALDQYLPAWEVGRYMYMYLRTILVSLLLIGGGIWLMISNAKRAVTKEKI